MRWLRWFKPGGYVSPRSSREPETVVSVDLYKQRFSPANAGIPVPYPIGQGRMVFINEGEAKEFSARVNVKGKGIARLTTEMGEIWIDTSLLPGDTCEGDRFRLIIEKKTEQV